MGDPAGIGLDITLAAWEQRPSAAVPPFVLYGCPGALAARATDLGLSITAVTIEHPSQARAVFERAIPVIAVPLARDVVAGRPDARNAAAVIASIKAAVAAVEDGTASAVVTNPIAKSVLYDAGFKHPGHTEFLAALAAERRPGTCFRSVMLLADPALRVVPLTIHVPLADVARLVTRDLIVETVTILRAGLISDFAIAAPRIVVAGLNPHAGEGGAIGDEESRIVAPAISDLVARGWDVRGPLSADTLFHSAARATYDAAVCMYHDQALIPIKTLAFDTGVNVTLGLPFVRTSPDHGTAFDRAGSGRASASSLIAALRLAAEMTTSRARQAAGRSA